jgi:hypothetical protein
MKHPVFKSVFQRYGVTLYTASGLGRPATALDWDNYFEVLESVAYRGGCWGFNPPPRNSEVLTKLSRIPSSVENTCYHLIRIRVSPICKLSGTPV